MDVVSALAGILRDVLTVVAIVIGLLVVLLIIISRMRRDNPLKRLLMILGYRLGATAAAGIFAIPIEPIPGLDALYDIGAPILLIWYWLTFFRDAGSAISKRRRPPQIGSDTRTRRIF